jgi:hypothetical protein
MVQISLIILRFTNGISPCKNQIISSLSPCKNHVLTSLKVESLSPDFQVCTNESFVLQDGQIDYGEFSAMMRKGNGGIGRRTMRSKLNLGDALGLTNNLSNEPIDCSP